MQKRLDKNVAFFMTHCLNLIFPHIIQDFFIFCSFHPFLLSSAPRLLDQVSANTSRSGKKFYTLNSSKNKILFPKEEVKHWRWQSIQPSTILPPPLLSFHNFHLLHSHLPLAIREKSFCYDCILRLNLLCSYFEQSLFWLTFV